MCLELLSVKTSAGVSIRAVAAAAHWFNSLWPSDTIKSPRSEWTVAQVMTCCLMKPLLEPMLIQNFVTIYMIWLFNVRNQGITQLKYWCYNIEVGLKQYGMPWYDTYLDTFLMIQLQGDNIIYAVLYIFKFLNTNLRIIKYITRKLYVSSVLLYPTRKHIYESESCVIHWLR